MLDRFSKPLVLALLAAILLSQWLIGFLNHKDAALQLSAMQSIESLLKHQSDTTTEMVASLEDLADVVDDIHDHVDGSAK